MKNQGLIQQKMSSREIAQIMGKSHRNVLRDIRSMEVAWQKVNGLKFALVEYIDKKGEKRPEYQLSKLEALYVSSKYDDEARARLVMRWYDLEMQQQEFYAKLHTPVNGIYPIYQNGVIGLPRKEQLIAVERSYKNGYRLRHKFGDNCFNIGRTACISTKLAQVLVAKYEVRQLELDLFNEQLQISNESKVL
ncbi:MAG TPA: Rha family transcriptional regulator [Crocinitomicaceae bacterium]|nr:Rha family transcriptional regulator [Crocinitomicaceae bacterium]